MNNIDFSKMSEAELKEFFERLVAEIEYVQKKLAEENKN